MCRGSVSEEKLDADIVVGDLIDSVDWLPADVTLVDKIAKGM